MRPESVASVTGACNFAERVAVHRPSVTSAARRDWRALLDRINPPADCGTIQEEPDWLEPQVENIYYHERPAIQEHNVSADKDMLAIRRRRRQLPFKIDGNSINPSP
jgi:hypothetical protein